MCPTLKIHAYWVRSYVDGGLRCKECPSDLITNADIDIDIVDNRLASCSELVHHFTAILLIETRQRLWRRSIVVRTLVSAGELSLSCARLLAGWVTTLRLSRPLSVSHHGQLSHLSLRGR